MPRTPTLEDVAAQAGVSTATVSRCLNAPEMVVEATRARVLAAVEALGYAPNFSARALVAKKTQTIGAIIPTMENAIFAEGIQAFQEALHKAGYTLLISSSGYDPKAEAEAIRTLVARGADGLLLIGFDRSSEIYGFLETQSIPSVVAWAHAPKGPLPSVGFDNAKAMYDLVARAIDLGHRTIGMISAPTAGNDRARARVEGATAAAKSAGLPDLKVIETPYGFAEGGDAFEKLKDQQPELSLVVCGNDVLAAGVLQRAQAMGISVPEKLSVTGFDDIALSRMVTPPLATVRVPHRQMGEKAAEIILAQLTGQSCAAHVLETEIRLRASLARPAKQA